MKIAVIGTGYVGLVTGACFAETGNDVICMDTDGSKIERLNRGENFFYEPGLPELVSRNVAEGRLRFLSEPEKAMGGAEDCFICVGTPSGPDGSADLAAVYAVAEAMVQHCAKGALIAVKSTVPVGTCDKLKAYFKSKKREDLCVISNPEFLREGTAVQDCLVPDRIVIGTADREAAETFQELYGPYVRTGNPIFVMDVRSAEMTKYAANSFLAMRISFINEMSMICDRVGADVSQVRVAIGADKRIGPQYLFPSIGFGGACFPKDVKALATLARQNELDPYLLTSTLDVNDTQKRLFTERVVEFLGGKRGAQGKRVAIWGLSFKAKTDDIRESPALTVIDGLLAVGAKVAVYDPVAMPRVQAQYGEKLTYVTTAYSALDGASALCVLTEWNQFRHPDFGQMKKRLEQPVVFDGRNLYDPAAMQKLGFTYFSIGRPKVGA